MRRILAPLAALGLATAVAGCYQPPQSTAASNIKPSISAKAQGAGGAVVVDRIAMPTNGWIVIHAVRDGRGVFHAFAAFATYQSALVDTSGGRKTRVSILHYPDLDGDDVELLALECLLDSIELDCLDRKVGLEFLRRLLDEEIDKRILQSLFGTARLSRNTFARLAGVSVGALKTQHVAQPQGQLERPNARQAVLRKLSS